MGNSRLHDDIIDVSLVPSSNDGKHSTTRSSAKGAPIAKAAHNYYDFMQFYDLKRIDRELSLVRVLLRCFIITFRESYPQKIQFIYTLLLGLVFIDRKKNHKIDFILCKN